MLVISLRFFDLELDRAISEAALLSLQGALPSPWRSTIVE